MAHKVPVLGTTIGAICLTPSPDRKRMEIKELQKRALGEKKMYKCTRNKEGQESRVEMTHKASTVPRMQNPTGRLGKRICGIDDARDMVHKDVTIVFPILDGECLNFNMARSFSGATCVNDLNGRNVVHIDRRGG